jgi:hypothetical protein
VTGETFRGQPNYTKEQDMMNEDEGGKISYVNIN